MTQPTTREARTQLVLTVIAIAVGGIVFAGRRLRDRRWRRRRRLRPGTPGDEGLGRKSDHQVNTASEPDHEPARR